MIPSRRHANGSNREQATLAGGCFWCLEAVFELMDGIDKVESGYTGGHSPSDASGGYAPSYAQVCSETTGHAEAVQLTFDPVIVSFRSLLEVFFLIHDPTTLNRQGPDFGTQYRSAIFYHNQEQKIFAERSKRETDASDLWADPIVTEIVPLGRFFAAETHHQNYYRLNPTQSYCQLVISPKLRAFKEGFGETG